MQVFQHRIAEQIGTHAKATESVVDRRVRQARAEHRQCRDMTTVVKHLTANTNQLIQVIDACCPAIMLKTICRAR